MKKLFIVESPAKAKTIGKYLGTDYMVRASVGHVRDLPKKGGLAIKITQDKANGTWTFDPTYEISAEKKKVVAELRAAAKVADEIILAPDPDREGEAIAWHLQQVLESAAKGKKFSRVTYNEITKGAVLDAVANPRAVDMARVDAQQARRMLDRLVGFKVSPLLWKYLSYGHNLSAGRVQSVALRLLVERERQIMAFKSSAYWVLGVEARKRGQEGSFLARLRRLDGEKPDITAQDQASALVDDLDGASLFVTEVKTMEKTRHAYPPFTTSTLQQAASSVYGFSPKRTMTIAQKLYEDGLITYMRTDSVNVAETAREAAKKYIQRTYGASHYAGTVYKTKETAQGAHEAIRPTDVVLSPDAARVKLDASSAKLYELIWRRFVSSQMADAKLLQRTVKLEATKNGESLRHDYEFTASSTSVTFDGFLVAMPTALLKKTKRAKDGEDEDSDEVDELPPMEKGNVLEALRWLSERKETKPPARFSEASLIRQLEENGVGRPSTYAQTIEVLVDHRYVKRENKQLVPEQRGMDVSDWLVSKLEPLFNVGYTAQMEAELDRVEAGEIQCNDMLSAFYRKFVQWVDAAKDPPPPREKFDALFMLTDEIPEDKWAPPKTFGKRTYDDRRYVESLREQLELGERPASEKQLQALVNLVIKYRDSIPNGEQQIMHLGYANDLERVKNAPSSDLVKWVFAVVEQLPVLMHNEFIGSLRKQVEGGINLSARQFSVLAKAVGESCGALLEADDIRRKLEKYVDGGFGRGVIDNAIPELIKLLDCIQEWKEPVRRGKRIYNDAEFAASLKTQYLRNNTLSPKQVNALKVLLAAYREQIPNFADAAVRFGINTDVGLYGRPKRPML